MPSSKEPVYRVVIEEKMWQRVVSTSPPAVRREAERLRDDVLPFAPTDVIAAGHRLKRLRGKLAGIWQFDLPAFHRLRYTVDGASRTVFVVYIGPHPND